MEERKDAEGKKEFTSWLDDPHRYLAGIPAASPAPLLHALWESILLPAPRAAILLGLKCKGKRIDLTLAQECWTDAAMFGVNPSLA